MLTLDEKNDYNDNDTNKVKSHKVYREMPSWNDDELIKEKFSEKDIFEREIDRIDDIFESPYDDQQALSRLSYYDQRFNDGRFTYSLMGMVEDISCSTTASHIEFVKYASAYQPMDAQRYRCI